MRCLLATSAALALALQGVFAAGVSAQSVYVGGGATVPTGDYGNYASVGFMAFGGVLVPVGDAGVSVGAQGFWGTNSHDVDGDKTNLYGGMGIVGFTFSPEATASPFVFGGLGLMTHSFKSDSTPSAEGSVSDLAAGFGAGMAFPLGSIGGMVAASYNRGFGDIDGTEFVGISAAVQIPVGGN